VEQKLHKFIEDELTATFPSSDCLLAIFNWNSALLRVLLPLLLFCFISSKANPAEYSVTFSYDGSISPTKEEKKTQNPYIGLQISDVLFESENYNIEWKTSLGFQNNSIKAPNGILIENENATIHFTEPTAAASKKIKGELAIEISKKVNDFTGVYAGIGLGYEEENIKYNLGSWTFDEKITTFRKQIYSGIELKILSAGSPSFRFQTGLTEDDIVLQFWLGLTYK
jgi:hypothetical protein